MAQRPVAERVEELQRRIEALRESKQRLEARQAAAERKRQERRRYLLGSFLLERLGLEGPWRELVRQELPAFLKEERDRQLFAELLDGQASNGATEAREPLFEVESAGSVASPDGRDVGWEHRGTD